MLTEVNEYWTRGTHILFRDIGTSKSGLTRVFAVMTQDQPAMVLGHVRWFARWRKYWFEPLAGTGYEETCLQDIADFVKAKTKAHRAEKHATQGS